MNLFNVRATFEQKVKRGWDTIYILIDVHGVLIPGSYHLKNDFTVYCPEELEVLEWFTNREDIKIILWTSSYASEVTDIMNWFGDKGIFFDYVNENPECRHTQYADFSRKPYFNILFDDKAGFEPGSDWKAIKEELISIGEWSKVI